MGPDQVLRAAVPMVGAAEALAALGASLRLRRDGSTVDPELAARLDAVVDALGVGGAVNALHEHETVSLLGIVEGFLAQAADFVVQPGRVGWDYEEPSILLAQGHTSALIAGVLRRYVVPSLGEDLEQRLDGRGAAFLDVGAGVAALSVALCRTWPSLRVVGIDPWEPALALARTHVAAAGLEERIELRQIGAETLEDADAYDLAWVPTFFIPAAVLERVIERVHAASRPGGWALLGLYARPGDPLRDALADLRTLRHGGALLTPAQAAALLERAGFSDVDVHFDAAWELPVVYVAGRRGAAR
jgi:SAM-dependent methyltransferase